MPKLILVSHRLPITISRQSGGFKYNQSVGGLATGLSAFSRIYESIWIGYCGIPTDEMSSTERGEIKTKLTDDFNCRPVFLDNNDIKMYYNGYSNNTIWPLFHYFSIYTSFDSQSWEAYKAVNEKFYNEIIRLAEPGDLIWVHDYQLMLLPQLIKRRMPDVKIGFFLHIPFPSYEIFRTLPDRKELLEGVLGADLIGFHCYSYFRHFLSSVLRVCGHENIFGHIKTGDRTVNVDVFPMGIDYKKYSQTGIPSIQREVKSLRKKLERKKLILSIDRMDYTKGLVQRLEAYDLFLEKYPQYKENITLVIAAVPSRTDITLYSDLKDEVDKMIGKINGKYSTLDWTPIWYLYRPLPFEKLMSLYVASDIALLTPLRDGMNLVAKEYIAAKTDKKGVLIISEMAGVAEEVGEALIINPNSKDEIADALHEALSMDPREQASRIELIQERLKRNDVFSWARHFIDKLVDVKKMESTVTEKMAGIAVERELVEAYKSAKGRLFLLDYDGTLTGFKDNPADAVPNSELYTILKELIKEEKNHLVIISGRDREFLEKHFGGLDVELVAEHGAWVKKREGSWETITKLEINWKDEIRPILEHYVDRTPRTNIEEKEYSLVWHYRKADPEFATIRVNELKVNLLDSVANLNLRIMEGNKIIEVKNFEINKGKVSSKIIAEGEYDFITAFGDDWTDEDIFSALPERAYSFKVGYTKSKARFHVKSVTEVRALLSELGKN